MGLHAQEGCWGEGRDDNELIREVAADACIDASPQHSLRDKKAEHMRTVEKFKRLQLVVFRGDGWSDGRIHHEVVR